MGQMVAATFIDGVLKPDGDLGLATGARVRLIVDPWDDVRAADACDEIDRLCEQFPIESPTQPMTRDELHDRR